MRASTWNRVILFLSFAGIFVAGYLAISAIGNWEIPCGASHGCDAVEQSAYSHWLGIPVAVYGLGAYLALAALAMLRTMGRSDLYKNSIRAGVVVSGIGSLVSAFLVYLSVTEIHATCLWCISSGVIMALSFFAHGFLLQSEEGAVPSKEFAYPIVLAILALGGLGFRFMDLKKAATEGQIDASLLPAKIEGMIPASDAHIFGPKDAPVIIVEFGDLICPHCKDSYNELTKVVQMSNGQVEFVFRQFPLVENPSHQMAAPAAAISEIAAEKGKFWDFVDQMYSTEDQEKLTMDDLYAMANKVGLTNDYLQKRLGNENDPVYQHVDNDLQLGLKMNIKSTPTLVIGIRGHAPTSGLASTIRQDLLAPPYSQYIRGLQ